MDIAATRAAAALAALLTLSACAGAAGDGDWAADKCTARGLSPAEAGWQACLDEERQSLRRYRTDLTRVQGI